jgi:spermidine/putrescine transport system substrate-binding protein
MSRPLTAMFVCLCVCATLVSGVGCRASRTAQPLRGPAYAREITLLDWADDVPQSVLDAFETEYKVRVKYVAYEDEAEAAGRIAAGEVFDVAVFDSFYLGSLVRNGLLAEIDYRNVTNFKNVAANFRDLAYDPGNAHSVPFNWGITALLVRTDLVPRPVTRWADLWEMEGITIGLRNEMRESLGMALRALGHSANTEDPQQLQEALERLLELRGRAQFVGATGDDSARLLTSGEINVMVGWQEDAVALRAKGVPMAYILPDEGAELWADAFVIPASSPNQRTAELFLDFLLRPEVAAAIANDNDYPSANVAALSHLDPEVRDDPLINPPSASLRNAELLLPLSEEGDSLAASFWAQFEAALH